MLTIILTNAQVVMYHDETSRNIWRSPDEGKTWNIIGGVPQGEAHMFIEHPFDTRIVRVIHEPDTERLHSLRDLSKSQAFILTAGTIHYRTIDRGATFASFETALPPAMNANTLSFHSRKSEWILFKGQRCEPDRGWKGVGTCHDEVC